MIASGRVLARILRGDLVGADGVVVLQPLRLRPIEGVIVLRARVVVPLRDGVLDAWLAFGDWTIDLGVGLGATPVTVTPEHTAATPILLDV